MEEKKELKGKNFGEFLTVEHLRIDSGGNASRKKLKTIPENSKERESSGDADEEDED